MSTALVSAFYEMDDVLLKNKLISLELKTRSDRRIVGSLPRRHSTNGVRQAPTNLITISDSMLVARTPRDRSFSAISSAEEERRRSTMANSSRYKTELCRPFEENGTCKYGDKCQFAHGMHELRQLTRHPKYKTELCRTFHTIGFCPYGPRCHFIHNADEKRIPLERSHSLNTPLSPLSSGSPPSPVFESPLSLSPSTPFLDDSPLGSPLPLHVTGSPANVSSVFNFPTHEYITSVASTPIAIRSSSSVSYLEGNHTVRYQSECFTDGSSSDDDQSSSSPSSDVVDHGLNSPMIRRLPVFNNLAQ